MHVAIFVDQHLDTLGGAQTSIRLQRKYLEKLGHKVTICSPSSHSKLYDKNFVISPSLPIVNKGEYHITIPTRYVEKHIDQDFAKKPPIDLVHVQADYWGAILGLSFARRHGLPAVITFHNNVQVGLYKVMGRHLTKLFIWWVSSFVTKFLGGRYQGSRTDAWDYLHNIALNADALLTPTHHFANTLIQHGVAEKIEAMSNGIDDDLLASIKKSPPNQVPVFIWGGRMSREKRLLEYVEAIKRANVPAKFFIYGNGDMFKPLERYIKKYKMTDMVVLHKAVSHKRMLQLFAASDVMVQTSVGFETQGMTVFEAISLGTPVILSDPLIAQDFPKRARWVVPDSSVDSLAATIKQAYSDLDGGERKHFSLGSEYDYRQSAMTAKMVKVYKNVVKSHAT